MAPPQVTAITGKHSTKDRGKLLDDKGADANHSTEKIVEIRKTVSGN